MNDRRARRGSTAGGHRHPAGAEAVDAGFSMVVTAISLLVTALLVLLLITTAFKSSGGSAKVADQPGVGQADDVQAQTSLETALSTAETAAAGSGGYGNLNAAGLAQFEPSLRFVTGASTSSDTISVAGSGAGSASGASAEGNGQDTGSVTLAARSASGRCWLLWKDVSTTWFGVQTGGRTCVAIPLASAPTAGAPSSTAIGWQPDAFPSGT